MTPEKPDFMTHYLHEVIRPIKRGASLLRSCCRDGKQALCHERHPVAGRLPIVRAVHALLATHMAEILLDRLKFHSPHTKEIKGEYFLP